MNFGRGRQHCSTLMNQKLPQKASCKSLSLHFDGEMTLRDHDHINHVFKNWNQFSGLVLKVRHLYPSNCLLLFYISFSESVITYGSLVYRSAAETNLKKS